MSQAEDARGERIHARDLRAGDQLDISGSYSRAGDIFLASTVRLGATDARGGGTAGSSARFTRKRSTCATASSRSPARSRETLEDATTLSVLDKDMNRTVKVWVTEDFAVRTKGASYTTADTLKVSDTVLIKAYTDTRGNLIAQTIRLRIVEPAPERGGAE